jgi:hypothetical protein
MAATGTQVTHCGQETLPAGSQTPARAGQSWMDFRGKTALTSIVAIKLRSPVRAASACARAAQQHRGRRSIALNSWHLQPHLALRRDIISRRRANLSRLRNHSVSTAPAIHQIRDLQAGTLENRHRAPAAKQSARSAPAPRPTRPGLPSATQSRSLKRPGHGPVTPPGRVHKLIPPTAAPTHATAAIPPLAIAPPARRVNVGLTVNRDDHVTKIPAVFVSATPQSQES